MNSKAPIVKFDDLRQYLPGGSARSLLPLSYFGIRPLLAIADLNILLDEVSCAARKQYRSSLAECQDAGYIVVAAPSSVLQGVPERLHRVAKGDESALHQVWKDKIIPKTWFFDVDEATPLPPWAAHLPNDDPEDIPFAQLYAQLRADLVLSSDKHLRRDFERPVISIEELKTIRKFGRQATPAIVTNNAMFVGLRLIKGIMGAAAKHPIIAAMTLGAGFLFFRYLKTNHPDTNNVHQQDFVSDALTRFCEDEVGYLNSKENKQKVEDAVAAWKSEEFPEDLMFRFLLTKAKPMRPKELGKQGWPNSAPPYHNVVARCLRDDPRFTRVDNGTWIPTGAVKPWPVYV